jgi:acyl-CoA thioesterase
MKHWDDCQELPYVKGVTPVHAASGDALECRRLPFTGNTSREMGGWVRLRGDVKEEAVTESHILALVDAWPPALMPFLKKPAMGSTLTWTIEFVQPLLELSTLDWCKYLAKPNTPPTATAMPPRTCGCAGAS